MKDAKKILPQVTFKFDGDNGEVEEHAIACSFGVLINFQALTGKDPWDGEQMSKLSPRDYVALVAAGIYGEKAAEHMEEVARKFGSVHMSTVIDLVNKLFENGLPVPKKNDESNQPSTESQPKS